jgi:nucleoside-diphosphate-sugar epimerase
VHCGANGIFLFKLAAEKKPMKKILIFGLSGQVGDALLPLLQTLPYQITAVSRQIQTSKNNIAWQQASFDDFQVSEKVFDAVISLGPLDQFSHWVLSSNSHIHKIIALSSTSIATKSHSIDLQEQKMAASLMASENKLLDYASATQKSVILLRPTLIYGNGRDHTISRCLAMAKRFNCFVLPKQAAGLRQPVHVQDIAAAIVSALLLQHPVNLTLDLPGGEILPFDHMLLRTLQVHLPQAKILRIANPLFAGLLKTAGALGLISGAGPGFFARLQHDLVFNPGPAEQVLGYRPRPFSP